MGSVFLAWRNINSSVFRSATIFFCAALMASFVIAATMLIGGAQNSLRLALSRLGADIIVVPSGAEREMENAFLMGVPAKAWMPAENAERIAAIPGVERVSPQLYLSTLRGATCCSVPEMFLIAYDPATDFTLRPWLESHLAGGLGLGEAIGGAFVYLPADQENILVYGYGIDLKGNLEQTGTGIDQTMFITFETAKEVALLSKTLAVRELEIPPQSISAAMVKLPLGSDPAKVAAEIERTVPGVTAVVSTNLFHSHRVHLTGLLQSVVALLLVGWALCVALIGLVYSVAVNERRRDIGVLLALGLPRRFVLQSLLSEGLIIAAAGAVAGVLLGALVVFLFHDLLVTSLSLPFLIPDLLSLLLLAAAALVLALASVTLGAAIPTLRVGTMDPALAMRK